ncbi:hypothetical protein PAMP_015901 [Pampus punctatissimus]
MNIILLIVIFTLGLGCEGLVHHDHTMSNNSVKPSFNDKPCQKNNDNNAYNKFTKKHIFQYGFNTASTYEWRMYLKDLQLCNRSRQSFIRKEDEARVQKICNGSGRRVRGNLCVSDSPMMVYELNVKKNCQVKLLGNGSKYVTVACDKIENGCLPVHYEKTQYPLPNKKRQRCGSPA